ncbi:unnamed protein product, partial [Staurois parvus]
MCRVQGCSMQGLRVRCIQASGMHYAECRVQDYTTYRVQDYTTYRVQDYA